MSLSGTRLHGQAVKTQPSHGCNRGSNPLGVTKKTRTLLRPCFFVVRIPVLRLVSRPATGCTLARLALAVRRIPLESPKKLISDAPKRPFFYTPVLRLVLRHATGCTLARFALAVRRIPSKPVKNFGRFCARSFLFFPRKLSLPQPANCEL